MTSAPYRTSPRISPAPGSPAGPDICHNCEVGDPAKSDKLVSFHILPRASSKKAVALISCHEHMNTDETDPQTPAPGQPAADEKKAQIKAAKAKLKLAKAAVKTAKKEAGQAKKELKGLKKEKKKAATKAKKAKK